MALVIESRHMSWSSCLLRKSKRSGDDSAGVVVTAAAAAAGGGGVALAKCSGPSLQPPLPVCEEILPVAHVRMAPVSVSKLGWEPSLAFHAEQKA